MRILLLTETLHAGGAETFVLRLARKLNALGDECHILNLNPDIENSGLLASYPELRILRAPFRAPLWLRRVERRLARLGIGFSPHGWLSRRLIEREYLGRYDVFHTHLFKMDLVMAQVRRRHPQVRSVSTLHGDYQLFHDAAQHGKGERIARWNEKMELLGEQCSGWAYIADKQADLLSQSYGVPSAKLHKIYNGFEPALPVDAPARNEPGKGLTWVMVARGIREKGWDHLICAFRKLDPGSRLLLVGDGPYLDELRALHAGEPGIEFLGFHPNPVEVIRAADVFVFPSLYSGESLPTVVIEALYCGVPVIATSVGEIPAMLETPLGELCGQLLSDPSPERLTERVEEAMTRYLADRDLLARHRELTSSAFLKFDMTLCAERYRALYRSVIAS